MHYKYYHHLHGPGVQLGGGWITKETVPGASPDPGSLKAARSSTGPEMGPDQQGAAASSSTALWSSGCTDFNSLSWWGRVPQGRQRLWCMRATLSPLLPVMPKVGVSWVAHLVSQVDDLFFFAMAGGATIHPHPFCPGLFKIWWMVLLFVAIS